MFTLNPVSLGLTDSTFPTSLSPSPVSKSTTKLKDSCHNCAKAKLRCSKEKPTCSRCAKRSKTCQYFATKRAGRKRISSLNSSSSTDSSNSMQRALTPSTSPLTETTSSLYLDILSGLGSPVDPVLMPNTEASCPSSTDFFASWISIPSWPRADTEISDRQVDILDNYPVHPDFLNSDFITTPAKLPKSTLSTTFELFSGAEILPGVSSPPKHRLLGEGSTESTSQPGSNINSPSCLSRAADILNRLCSHSHVEHTGTSNTGVSDKAIYRISKPEHIIKDSGHVTEVVNGILQCPCSRDGCVLVLVYLIVFKVLDRYAAAAQQTLMVDSYDHSDIINSQVQRLSNYHYHQNDPTPYPSEGNRGIHDKGRPRIVGQLILGEIHHVQQLVNTLSHRLRGTGEHIIGLGEDSSSSAYHCGSSDRGHSLDLPPTILALAELDLRNRLCALSVRLGNILKRE